MPPTDPDDDETVIINKSLTRTEKLAKFAHKPCEYWHAFVLFCLGFIFGTLL
jgi:hypothetical protein